MYLLSFLLLLIVINSATINDITDDIPKTCAVEKLNITFSPLAFIPITKLNDLNCIIKNAKTAISIAGIKIFHPILSAFFLFSSSDIFLNSPILTCFVSVNIAHTTSKNPTITPPLSGKYLTKNPPNANIIPTRNQNKKVPNLACLFFKALMAVTMEINPQSIYINSSIKNVLLLIHFNIFNTTFS